MSEHEHTPMERVPRTEHYSNRNWSALFRCPVCGSEKRQNTNFLGRRVMLCRGVSCGPYKSVTATQFAARLLSRLK